MRINRKYLIRHSSLHRQTDIDNHGDFIINDALVSVSQAMQEGDNFKQEIYPAFEEDNAVLEISCVVLHPDIFRHMVEKIDYHDPYYMDLILPDLSTIEQ